MKKGHSKLWIGISVFFFAAVYSVILFLLKKNFDISAWVLYGSTMIAFILLAVHFLTSSNSGLEILFEMPRGIITSIYFSTQFIIGGIILMFFRGLPLTPVVICELVILIIYLMRSFFLNILQSDSEAREHNAKTAVRSLRMMESEVRGLAESETNPAIKKALFDLAEEIHFSTPSPQVDLSNVEGRIEENLSLLHNELAARTGNPIGRISFLKDLVKERERTAAILKQ